MKFFYNLERYENGEYVILTLEENGKVGIGAVIPERKKGENYKTIMGVVEEYRHTVESAKPEHFASISFKLKEDFPNHPKVTFAISAAATELFSKISKMRIEELLMCEGLRGAVMLTDWVGDIVVPEEIGGVFEVLSMASQDRALLLRRYPHDEMSNILHALSRYFAGYFPSSW